MLITDKFQGLNVLIVGDVILDSYWVGRADRISPEAPVPIVLFDHEEQRLGGAANVALNVKALGANPFLVSVVGDDADGKIFAAKMEAEQISSQGLLALPNRPTTVKTRIVAKNQQLLRCDKEVNTPLSENETQQLWKIICQIVQQKTIHVVIFQDYDKGVLTPTLIRLIQNWATENKVPTAVDPKKRHFFHFNEATLFKPNLREVNEGLGIVIPERDFQLSDLETAASAIRHQLHNTYTLITLGAKGMYLSSPSLCFYQPTQERVIADVCGAGDTVISVAALGLAAGLDIKDTVALANIAGGQVCEQWGTVAVNAQQLAQEYALYRG